MNVRVEAIRATNNRMGIPMDPEGGFDLPDDDDRRAVWHRTLVRQPLNPAEALRRDMGLKVGRR